MKFVKAYASNNNKVTSSVEMATRAAELSLIQKVKRMMEIQKKLKQMEWAVKGCRKKIADLNMELELLNIPPELR